MTKKEVKYIELICDACGENFDSRKQAKLAADHKSFSEITVKTGTAKPEVFDFCPDCLTDFHSVVNK